MDAEYAAENFMYDCMIAAEAGYDEDSFPLFDNPGATFEQKGPSAIRYSERRDLRPLQGLSERQAWYGEICRALIVRRREEDGEALEEVFQTEFNAKWWIDAYKRTRGFETLQEERYICAGCGKDYGAVSDALDCCAYQQEELFYLTGEL